MVALQSSTLDVRDHFPGGASRYLLFNSDILNFLLKKMGDTEVIFIIFGMLKLSVGGW